MFNRNKYFDLHLAGKKSETYLTVNEKKKATNTKIGWEKKKKKKACAFD